MPKFKDLTGKKYGRLTVIKRDNDRVARKGKKRTYWLCRCDCGNEISVRSDMLGKYVRSCGCLKIEQDKINLSKYTEGKATTGKSHSRLACIWYHMKDRCYNKKSDRYQEYGKRGVSVCEEWKNNFLAFEKWSLENGYADNLSIDRIDVNGNYEPNNCRWATNLIQANNKQRTLWVEYNGEYMSLMECYRKVKPSITYQTARERYAKGIRTVEELFVDNRQYRDKQKD